MVNPVNVDVKIRFDSDVDPDRFAVDLLRQLSEIMGGSGGRIRLHRRQPDLADALAAAADSVHKFNVAVSTLPNNIVISPYLMSSLKLPE